jgi:hypothetical protein
MAWLQDTVILGYVVTYVRLWHVDVLALSVDQKGASLADVNGVKNQRSTELRLSTLSGEILPDVHDADWEQGISPRPFFFLLLILCGLSTR